MNEQELVDLLKTKVDELNKVLKQMNENFIYVHLSPQELHCESGFKSTKHILICEIVKPLHPSITTG